MRIWLIGAGRVGSAVIRQLSKNPQIEVIVSDPHEQPLAVRDGIISSVDFTERVTIFNINQVAQRVRPDLILIATGSGSQSYGNIAGATALGEALNYEIATASEVPCVVVSRSLVS